MAAKDISVKKYVVRLSGEEREQLEVLIRKGAADISERQIVIPAGLNDDGRVDPTKRLWLVSHNYNSRLHSCQVHPFPSPSPAFGGRRRCCAQL